MSYNSKYKGSEVEALLDKVQTLENQDLSGYATKEELGGKQDKIDDLAAIRSGAEKGATALQEHQQLKTINGESVVGNGDITIESGAKIYEWFYDGESESITLSQEEYDNIVEADLVVVNFGGFFSVTASKTSKEVSEALGHYALIGRLEAESEGIKLHININIEISTKVATITTEEQEILTKTSQLENDSNFITSEDVAAVALSGSYNDLQDTPTIPPAVTESTVSGWGFTKNTGTYSKPSGGIPKTDLASAVQTSLGKADSALQSYTEKYTGTITGIKMNGASKGTSGVVDLGTVITSHQDISGKADKSSLSAVATSGSYNDLTDQPDFIKGVAINGTVIADTSGTVYIPNASTGGYGVTKLNSSINSTSTSLAATPSAVKAAYDLANSKQNTLVSGTNIKTINGTSILGSGNIEIGGGSSSGGGAYPEVDGSRYEEVNGIYACYNASPNTFYVFPECASLAFFPSEDVPQDGLAHEYLFQFTSGATAASLILPEDIKWTEDLIIEPNRIYQVSILKGLASVLEFDNRPLVEMISFTVDGTPYQAPKDMTWQDFCDSEYNTYGFFISFPNVMTPQNQMLYSNGGGADVNFNQVIQAIDYTQHYIGGGA